MNNTYMVVQETYSSQEEKLNFICYTFLGHNLITFNNLRGCNIFSYLKGLKMASTLTTPFWWKIHINPILHV